MKNKIIVIVAFLATTLFISSCLKDNVSIDWYGVSGKMYATFTNAGQVWTKTIVGIPDAQSYTVQLNVATDAVLSKDYTIDIAIDSTVMTDYNASAGKSFHFFPTASIPSSVVVKAGGRTAWFTVTMTGADVLDLNTQWMVPIKIVSTSSPDLMLTSNKNTFLLAVAIMNKYEADYHAVGFRHHPVLGDIASDKVKHLSTVDANTVETYPADYSPYRMDMTVNPDNTTTVISPDAVFHNYTDPTLDPVGRGIPAGPNTYDPVNKVFNVFVFYNAAAPRIITETFTRLP